MSQNIINITKNITVELQESPTLSENFAFSRYLYVIDDVKSSLLLSIVDQSPKEALYWAYELYFSGFKDDAFTTLLNIAQTMYSPKVQRFVQQQKTKWEEDPDQYWLLGTAVWYLADRQANVGKFIAEFCQDPTLIEQIKNTVPKRDTHITILLEKKDIEAYINVETDKPNHLLKHVLQYSPRTQVATIFEHDHAQLSREELLQLWRENWLYYASKSPLWHKRIAYHGGVIDHIHKTVTFVDPFDEEFHEKYYYDTDEQPRQIVELCLGKEEPQWTWQQLYYVFTMR
jgi:hypothetical protein